MSAEQPDASYPVTQLQPELDAVLDLLTNDPARGAAAADELSQELELAAATAALYAGFARRATDTEGADEEILAASARLRELNVGEDRALIDLAMAAGITDDDAFGDYIDRVADDRPDSFVAATLSLGRAAQQGLAERVASITERMSTAWTDLKDNTVLARLQDSYAAYGPDAARAIIAGVASQALGPALALTDRAIERWPDDVGLRVGRIGLLIDAGSPQAALDEIERLGDPTPDELLPLTALALGQVGEMERALEIVERLPSEAKNPAMQAVRNSRVPRVKRKRRVLNMTTNSIEIRRPLKSRECSHTSWEVPDVDRSSK